MFSERKFADDGPNAPAADKVVEIAPSLFTHQEAVATITPSTTSFQRPMVAVYIHGYLVGVGVASSYKFAKVAAAKHALVTLNRWLADDVAIVPSPAANIDVPCDESAANDDDAVNEPANESSVVAQDDYEPANESSVAAVVAQVDAECTSMAFGRPCLICRLAAQQAARSAAIADQDGEAEQ